MRRKTKRSCTVLALIIFGVVAPVPVTFADDAVVLPKGVFYFSVDGFISRPITKRFNADGDKEPLATDFNTTLDSSVFSDLSLVEAGFGMTEPASFGTTNVDFTRNIQIYNFYLAFGVTDKLSIGVNIPYWNQSVDVQASLDNSTATVGFNAFVPGGVAPLTVPGTRDPTTEDIQNLLVSEGFDRVEDWSDSSFGDVIAGAKYQYHQSKNWRLAAAGGVMFPTGTWDDPNNLVDNNTGWDAWGLRIRLHQDYLNHITGDWQGGRRTLSPGEYLINTTLGYDVIFPDTKPFRVCDVHTPVCPDFDANVERDTGDILEAGLSGVFGVGTEGLSVGAFYTYSHKMKDKFHGNLGFDYDLLAIESDYRSHIVELKLSYSTIPRYIDKTFPVPMTVSLRYLERVAATNNQFNSSYVGLTFEVFLQ